MRQPKHRNNQLLKPLDQILGTPANVRLLRVLALRSTPVTAGDLARGAALSRTSIYPALRQLELAGIVELVGAGSQRPVQLRDRHPLSKTLKDLFRTEAKRFVELTVALRKLHSDLPHPPMSAWLDETADDTQSGDALRLHVVAKPGGPRGHRGLPKRASPRDRAEVRRSHCSPRAHTQRARHVTPRNVGDCRRHCVTRWSSAKWIDSTFSICGECAGVVVAQRTRCAVT